MNDEFPQPRYILVLKMLCFVKSNSPDDMFWMRSAQAFSSDRFSTSFYYNFFECVVHMRKFSSVLRKLKRREKSTDYQKKKKLLSQRQLYFDSSI